MTKPSVDAHTVYSAEQFESNYPEGIERNFWNIARNRLITDLVLQHGGAGARVLDVGCGSGIVVEALRRAGLDAEGAEIGTPPVKPVLAACVHIGQDAFAWRLGRRAGFDFVMACDVIEHVPEPTGFLASMREKFPAARHCLVTVPARRELWSNYDEVYGHFLRYDFDTLRRQLTEAGMEVVTMRYAFHSLYAVMGAMKLTGIKRTVDYTPPRREWFDRLVASYFTLERKLLPGSIPGTSVVAVARIRR